MIGFLLENIMPLEKIFYLIEPKYPEETWEDVDDELVEEIRQTWELLTSVLRQGET